MTMRELVEFVSEVLAKNGLRVYKVSGDTLDVEVVTGNHERIDTFSLTFERVS